MIADSGGSRSAVSLSAWREFLWGGLACGFGETIMHPVDTIKTRLQSGFGQNANLVQVSKTIGARDGIRGFYRGVFPGVTGSFVTGATYFGFIETTKDLLQEKRPNLPTPWALFFAGAAGDALGAVVYVPCEVIKQRMQVQGSRKAWETAKQQQIKAPVFQYYSGMFHAARAIHAQEGTRGLYAGLLSTIVRDIPFAGLQIVLYEAFRKTALKVANGDLSCSQDFLLGGAAGGFSAFLTTPFDVVKTRMQVQSTSARYTGWLDAITKIKEQEGIRGLFKGAGPRVMWWCPASALTFMAVEKLRREFNDKGGLQILSQAA
ncbi:hypothetical protein SELMODRAFT_437889 [Selaginella moellendorffii]|uniref:Uncharacterized protein mBAC7-1 n=1 Tax=Selaginella moellendorffii TaxID=88036 RepID=D8QRQ3_SELML|nr:S-adenosylmethionine carrier 1, chloroplastic/mitochondrial [Selaginella moellendorffii]EFJ37294.1 hypothetical protein SELMODRAFT_437889 [Selaginella moellendorffii]|eukprot:XP_024541823.1 S-adenosylmethionine carrier 1, chloroplastic/mitochondrial [Selaginella moellendorffii]